jgi:hypothetical protein
LAFWKLSLLGFLVTVGFIWLPTLAGWPQWFGYLPLPVFFIFILLLRKWDRMEVEEK